MMNDIYLFECSNCHKTIAEDDVAFDSSEPAPELRHSLEMLEYLAKKKFDILCAPCLKSIEQSMEQYEQQAIMDAEMDACTDLDTINLE